MLYVMPRIVLEAAMVFRTVTLITAAGAAGGAIAIFLFLLVAPPSWALGGGAISEIIVTIGYWRCARRVLRDGTAKREAGYRDMIAEKPLPVDG
jgi:membrane protein implicated in regulation of membrane protease activity